MNTAELERFLARRSLERGELADILNGSFGTKYDTETVSRWIRGARPIPKKVSAFLDELALEDLSGLAGAAGLEPGDLPLEEPTVQDTPPGGPSPEPQRQLVSAGGAYVTACEELWELIGAGVGMIGAAINSPALVYDGQIIVGDKQALGAAWGKLAQTNDTFRRMLVGMTEGGAWLGVALATGTTLSKCWQAHQHFAAQAKLSTDAAPDELADAA